MSKKRWSESNFLFVVFSLIFIFSTLFFLVFSLQQKTIEKETKLSAFSGGASSGTGTVRFCLDKSPSLTNPGNKEANVSSLFTLTINYSDEGCSTISFSDNSSLFNISSTGLINFTPSESSAQRTESINISLSDFLFTKSILFNISIGSSFFHPNYSKFSSSSTTNSSLYSEITNLSRYTLSTSYASIVWLNQVNVIAQNFDQYINFSNKFVSVDVANLNISLNSSAQLSIENITCPVNVYFVPYVALSNDDIIENGTVCSSTTDPSCTNIICSGTTVTFNVSHFSSYGAESSSGGGTTESIASIGGLVRRKTPTKIPFILTEKETTKPSAIEEQKVKSTLIPPELERPKQIILDNETLINSLSEKSNQNFYNSLSLILLLTLFIFLITLSFILSRK